jgi:serine-type D-Ala-D-Ala carboxypeptidase (penicillin-binding protein 5/6)
VALLSIAAALFAPATGSASPPQTDPVVAATDAAAYVVQVDGRTIRSRAPHMLRQPASLSKLALAMVVVDETSQSPSPTGQFAVVSKRAAAAPASRLGLRAGDRASVEDLLAAMLVASANDACLALAEHVAGSVVPAVGRMNQLAARLDMRDTRFADPCGFDQPGQQTTAADLLKLANAALGYTQIRRLAAERAVRVVVPVGSAVPRTLVASTSNALLDRVEGVTGLKTGHTNQAGRSIIAVAEQQGHEIIVVVLGARDRFHAALRLLDHGFANTGRTLPAETMAR